MATTRKKVFSRRVVDHLTDELVSALEGGETYEFKALFRKVYEGLKFKNAIGGGEEMLRLRSYEKLLTLTKRGLVQKSGRTFSALKGLKEVTTADKHARMAAAAAATAAK